MLYSQRNWVRSVILGAALLCLVIPAVAQRDPLFKTEILPVLEKNCVACHGPQQKMARLDLSSFTGMMEGSSSGPVIAPGKPERSLMWKLIENGQDAAGRQADHGRQAAHQVVHPVRAFPAGDGRNGSCRSRRGKRRTITAEDRNWWSFRKPVKPAVPAVKNTDQVRTPIDAFVLAQLEQKGWKMQPEADRTTLIRRAYFDLIGLPPTPAEVKAFVDDKSPNAWEKVIDHLLASPHYGEQWGRHWLDVAGYSDSRGDAGDSDREVSWKYRDYVIHAFNKNKPINRSSWSNWPATSWSTTSIWPSRRPDQIEPLTATGFLRTTADITDNQTIYEVDKYFDAQQKAMETEPHGADGRDHSVRPLPRPQVRSDPAARLLQADGRLSSRSGIRRTGCRPT